MMLYRAWLATSIAVRHVILIIAGCIVRAVPFGCAEWVFCTPSLQFLMSPDPCMLLISRYLMNVYALVSKSPGSSLDLFIVRLRISNLLTISIWRVNPSRLKRTLI